MQSEKADRICWISMAIVLLTSVGCMFDRMLNCTKKLIDRAVSFGLNTSIQCSLQGSVKEEVTLLEELESLFEEILNFSLTLSSIRR